MEAPVAAAVDKANFYDVNRAWLESDWVQPARALVAGFRRRRRSSVQQFRASRPRARYRRARRIRTSGGRVLSESQSGQSYSAQVEISRPGLVLFKMTWHPNWVAYVDGKVQPTAMLSPGFVGIPVAPGSTCD